MKKTMLIISLLTTLASFASTTGNVEVEGSIEKTLYQYQPSNNRKLNAKLKGEVGVIGSGFKAGIELKFNGTGVEHNGDSKAWAEYKFPKFVGITTTVKGTAKFNKEFDLEAKFAGFVSKTDLELKTVYKSTSLITPKNFIADFKATFNQVKDTKFITLIGFDKDLDKSKLTSIKYYGELGFEYKGFEDLLLKASTKVTLNEKHEVDLLIKGEAKYEGIKNLTLQAKVEAKLEKVGSNMTYEVTPEAWAEYKYMATKTITISPKFAMKVEAKKKANGNGASGSGGTTGNNNKEQWAELTLTPSVKFQYEPLKGLKFTGTPELPVKFKFDNYTPEVTGKFTANIKYEW